MPWHPIPNNSMTYNPGVLSTGTYYYRAQLTNAGICTSTFATSPAKITVNKIKATKVEGAILCNGGTTTVTITATGGTAPYTNDGEHIVSAGAYSFTVTDSKGCEVIVSGTISEPTLLEASAIEGEILCNGGTTTVTITATGGTAPYANDGEHIVSAGAYSFTV